ncbi:exported hypothetical protein [Desulfovibrionales bacterium]
MSRNLIIFCLTMVISCFPHAAATADLVATLHQLQDKASLNLPKFEYDNLLATLFNKYVSAGKTYNPLFLAVKHIVFDYMVSGFHWNEFLRCQAHGDHACANTHRLAAEQLWQDTPAQITKIEIFIANQKIYYPEGLP